MPDETFELDCKSRKRFRDTANGTGTHATNKDLAAEAAVAQALGAAYLQIFAAMLRVTCPDADCPIRELSVTISVDDPQCERVRTFVHVNGDDREWKCTVKAKWRLQVRCRAESKLLEEHEKHDWLDGRLDCDSERVNRGTATADADAPTKAEADKAAAEKAESKAFAESNRELTKLRCPDDCPVIQFTYVQRPPKIVKRMPVLGGGTASFAECEWAHRIRCSRT